MLLELRKDFGDTMALVKTGEHEAVLVLVEREETAGPFFTRDGDSRKYPIIKFEMPPELCGVEEPADAAAHAELRARLHTIFLDALIATCEENDITTVLCAGTENPNAELYRKRLAAANIELRERGE